MQELRRERRTAVLLASIVALGTAIAATTWEIPTRWTSTVATVTTSEPVSAPRGERVPTAFDLVSVGRPAE